MQCYTELTPPTAVTHSVVLPFVSAQSNNLVVAKSSLLQIFTTKVVPSELDRGQAAAQLTAKTSTQHSSRFNDDDGLESSFLGGDAVLLRSDRTLDTKLVLVAEFPVAGTITGLARIKTANTKSGGEALLVSFKDAKLSLVEWDPGTRWLATISIHYYEQDELQGGPWATPLGDCVNFLVSDPGSRCAAFKFGGRNLAILPFRQPDEDIDMADWDEDLDGPRPAPPSAVVDGARSIEDTPYAPSFVLRLSNLDPSLSHPVHLAFLHEYREPTVGILSSTVSPSASLGRKDHLVFMVFTLDLQQKASTTILSVAGLPHDLFRVVALPAPVGGALLVGSNELIYIDQSGKPNGVAVNPMTKQSTSFGGLADQSDLDLRLEGCTVELLHPESGELLLVLNDRRLALLTFHIDGRTVSGLSIKLIPPESGGSIIPCGVSSLSRLGRNTMFGGCQEGDSLVFGWSGRQGQLTRRRSRLVMQDASLDLELDEDDLEEDEDDLYAEATAAVPASAATSGAGRATSLIFRVHDRLLSLAPIQDLTYGQAISARDGEERKNTAGVRSDLQLVCAVGRGGAAALALINREIQPKIIGRFEFPEARGLWTMGARKPVLKALQGEKSGDAVSEDYDDAEQYDKFMIVAKVDLDGYETSDVYALTAAGFESLSGTEFEPAAGFTVEAGNMGNHRRIIQVLKAEVRCYDGNLGLSQILPMLDEDTGAEPRVVSASIADPYLLLIRDDASAFIAHMDSSYELEEVDKEDKTLLSTKWLAGCLYVDTRGIFAESGPSAKNPGETIVMFLLSAGGALYIYVLPDLSRPAFVADGLCYVPLILSSDFAARRGMAKEILAEILVADLGDVVSKSPHLIIRHANDDLTLYEPWRTPSSQETSLSKTLRFLKLPNATFAEEPEIAIEDDATLQPYNMPLRACRNVGGYSTVFLPGASPSFIIKSSKSLPRVIGLKGSGVQAMSSFHTEGCEQGLIYADSNGIARVTQMPAECSFGETGMAVRKVPFGQDIAAVAYHAPTETFVVACTFREAFELPKDDDYHKEWARETLGFKPTLERGVLKLVNPVSWSVIDTAEFDPCELPLCVEVLNLEVSEATHERRQLIAVGTANIKGEDLPTRGRIFVYDVVTVIPEPGRPETNRKLKLVAKEDIPRGAVTAISEVGTQGLMLVAQGQKCMVRGLKEDGTLLPVAFMDMNCYVTAARELRGTGLCLMADAFKGVWFTGYTEEPYKMVLFGKSATNLEVMVADFLPDGNELFIVACDADGSIHVLQFDPDHPKSLQGHLLLHRTSFNTGAHMPTHTLLLPNASPSVSTGPATNGAINDDSAAPPTPPRILLMASPTGVLSALRPLPETSYRHLSSLAAQLATSLTHTAGMNPKAYRLPPASAPGGSSGPPPGVDAAGGRGIVDGVLLARWAELSSGRRGEVAGRVGLAGAGEVRRELGKVLGWGGMEYF